MDAAMLAEGLVYFIAVILGLVVLELVGKKTSGASCAQSTTTSKDKSGGTDL